MGSFKSGSILIATTAVFGFGAGAALVAVNPPPFLTVNETPQAVQPVPQAAVENSSEEARVLAALEALEFARADQPDVQPTLQEVSRSEPVDLLQVAPEVQPMPEPTPAAAPEEDAPRDVATVDTAAAAAFFNTAQGDLAARDTCADDMRALAASTRVYFPQGGLSAANDGLASARVLGLVARDCPGFTIQVEGHSDQIGDPDFNRELSERRAETVIARLSAAGIDTSKFVSVGFGDTRPSRMTGPQDQTYYDRRVEFSIIKNVRTASLSAALEPAQTAAPAVSACVAALQEKAAQSRIFYNLRAITVTPGEMEVAQELVRETMACDGARLRLVGHFSDQPGSRETPGTARLRTLALMSSLVSGGAQGDRLLVSAPSRSIAIPGQPGLPKSRIDFQIITD